MPQPWTKSVSAESKRLMEKTDKPKKVDTTKVAAAKKAKKEKKVQAVSVPTA